MINYTDEDEQRDKERYLQLVGFLFEDADRNAKNLLKSFCLQEKLDLIDFLSSAIQFVVEEMGDD